MAVRIISTTELRSKAADMVLGLRRGDRFLIQHYNDIVGYITPEIPSDLLKKLGRLYEVEDFDLKKRQKLGLPPIDKTISDVMKILEYTGIEKAVKR